MRDHGGDLDRARRQYGGEDWLDLSTGINAVPYPLPAIPDRFWTALPTAQDIAALEQAAALAFGATAPIVALAGAQAAIQLVPRLRPPLQAWVVAPSYNEHAAALRAQGWQVTEVATPEAIPDDGGPDAARGLAVVVNPNNPDGRSWAPQHLLALARRVGVLVIDESFADPTPALSAVPHLDGTDDGVVVLRSFGKFYGLAGVRLGFALSGAGTVARLRALAGPWPLGGPAIAAGTAALADTAWASATAARLDRDAARLDDLARGAGWQRVGGTALFRTYDVGDAAAVQDHLARARIWTRIFPYSGRWLRLGLPGRAEDWDRLAAALLSARDG